MSIDNPIDPAELGFDPETQEARDRIKKDLIELGIETRVENIEAALEQQKTPQHPAGYEEILANLGNPEALKAAMKARKIRKIVHSEGTTVWDHAKTAIGRIKDLGLLPEREEALKLILLFHDLGKVAVAGNEVNKTATNKHLAKGELHGSMIDHAKERLADIKKGMVANEVSERDIKIFSAVIENHMATSIMEQDPKKTVKLFEGFGSSEEEIKQVVELLIVVLQLDGEATEHIELVDGELKYSKNETKTGMTVEKVWAKYLEGKKIIQAEEDRVKAKEAQGAFEKLVFGKKLSDYLKQDRGIEPGPAMGKAEKNVRDLLDKNKDLSTEDIRQIIDATEL